MVNPLSISPPYSTTKFIQPKWLRRIVAFICSLPWWDDSQRREIQYLCSATRWRTSENGAKLFKSRSLAVKDWEKRVGVSFEEWCRLNREDGADWFKRQMDRVKVLNAG